MTQFPMNNNTPNGQTHTIMESPIWMGRLHSYWPTFAVSWLSMFWVAPAFDHLKQIPGILFLFTLPIPLIVALYIDEKFTQTFFKRDWEESKKMDAMFIRGIPIPKIREFIEFQILLRKKLILYPSAASILLMFWSNDIEYVVTILIVLLLSIIVGAFVRIKIGYDKFGFNSLYFKDISSFKSFK